MLGVYLLPPFIRLGHECQESVQWNACVHRLDLSFYPHPKEFLGNGVGTHVNSKGNIPSTGDSEEDRVHTNHDSQSLMNFPNQFYISGTTFSSG